MQNVDFNSTKAQAYPRSLLGSTVSIPQGGEYRLENKDGTFGRVITNNDVYYDNYFYSGGDINAGNIDLRTLDDNLGLMRVEPDTTTSNLSMYGLTRSARFNCIEQTGGVNWVGDVDTAKFSTALGNSALTFGNDSGSATIVGAPQNWDVDGRTFYAKARIDTNGDFYCNSISTADLQTSTSTPNGTGTTNVTSIANVTLKVTRTKDFVTAHFTATMTPTGSGTQFVWYIDTLPFTANNFTTTTEAVGQAISFELGTSGTTPNSVGQITSVIGAQTVSINLVTPTATGAIQTVQGSFTYSIV